jgi:hypothetical protein
MSLFILNVFWLFGKPKGIILSLRRQKYQKSTTLANNTAKKATFWLNSRQVCKQNGQPTTTSATFVLVFYTVHALPSGYQFDRLTGRGFLSSRREGDYSVLR